MLKSRVIMFAIVAMITVVVFGGCAEKQKTELEKPQSEAGINDLADNLSGAISNTEAELIGEIKIEGLGSFTFDPKEIRTVRKDIFREGYFTIFDILVYLEEKGEIVIDYYFDEDMNTFIISSLDGHKSWWYDAYYDGGWPEKSVFRMDHYPYKDKMTLNIVRVSEEYLDSVYDTYRDEVSRYRENGGKVIIPVVHIDGKSDQLIFEDVVVKAHDLRSDMFQPGVVTAIDTILSLADSGFISYELQWYESIGTAGVVKSYWVNRINDDKSQGRCGFVYEAGDEIFHFFRGNHNHIPSDVRVINSPQYVQYFWICI